MMSKEYEALNFGDDQGTKTLLNEILSSVPGIDEAMSFAQLVKSLCRYLGLSKA
jgi:anion-transporting  ArsA/GET3 family ATPase